MFSIGASLLDADYVCGFEISSSALNIAMENLKYFDLNNVDIS